MQIYSETYRGRSQQHHHQNVDPVAALCKTLSTGYKCKLTKTGFPWNVCTLSWCYVGVDLAPCFDYAYFGTKLGNNLGDRGCGRLGFESFSTSPIIRLCSTYARTLHKCRSANTTSSLFTIRCNFCSAIFAIPSAVEDPRIILSQHFYACMLATAFATAGVLARSASRRKFNPFALRDALECAPLWLPDVAEITRLATTAIPRVGEINRCCQRNSNLAKLARILSCIVNRCC